MAKTSESPANHGSIKTQVLVALAASFGSFGFGAGITWTSPVFPRISQELCQDDCDISGVDDLTTSWIGSIYLIGAIVAGPASFILLSKIGRRWTLIAMAIPMLFGFIFLTISKSLDSIAFLLTGRFLTGFSGAAYNLLGPLYISEIAEPRIRGALASFTQFMIASGSAFVNGWNIYGLVSWTGISGICIAIPVILLTSLVFIPETPNYLVKKNRLEEAKESLYKLRGRSDNVEQELENIVAAKMEEDKIGSIGPWTLTTSPVYLAPFLLGLFGMVNLQLSGINVIFFYLQTIFVKAGSTIDPSLAAFTVAMTEVVSALPSVLMVDRFGRRILLIVGNILLTLSHFTLGTYFYLDENKCPTELEAKSENCLAQGHGFDQQLVTSLGWLPLVCLMVFAVSFTGGIGPLAWTLNAELYPAESKKLSASIAFTVCWLFAFMTTQFTTQLESAINTSGLFYFFGSACLISAIVDYFLLPETKCKTPEDMKQYFVKKFETHHGQ